MKKVAVWGKFDGLHYGHLEFLRHARELGDELYVVVIPDAKLENCEKAPIRTSESRRKKLIELGIVTDAYIDSMDDGLISILLLRPEIFAFGHDQRTSWEIKLKEYLSLNGLNPEYVYLGVYNEGKYNSDLRKV